MNSPKWPPFAVSAPATKTIDVLILESLESDNDGLTAGDLGRTWGEYWTRCNDCLEKLVKLELCYSDGFRYEKRNARGSSMPSTIYFGYRDKIRDYLAKKNPGVS